MKNITTETTLLTSDYDINYYGMTINISNTKKVLALFVSGSGYTGDMGQYYGGSVYDLFMVKDGSFGKELIKIGIGENKINGYGCSCWFEIEGNKRVQIDGFAIDDLFSEIFKK